MDKELLLGYLLNALDDRDTANVERELERNPSLRTELATLQQEIDPLDYIADDVEPPSNLATRTCDQIWTTFDGKNRGSAPNSGIFLDSACYSPESILPAGFLLQNSEPHDIEREIPRAKRIEIDEEEEVVSRSTPWLGLIASVSVGIVVAVFLFPMIQYVKRGARSLVTESWVSEINRRVDQYEQINQGDAPNSEETQPINLALYGWLGLQPEILVYSPLQQKTSEWAVHEWELDRTHAKNEVIRGQQPSFAPRVSGWDEPISLDTGSLSDHVLIIIPGQDNLIRLAYGQYILFKDTRIFFRELPNK